jgi:regulator of replication initiation timing
MQINYLHEELTKLKASSYQVIVDNEHLQSENVKLRQTKCLDMGEFKDAFEEMK